jgi:hypothetical protein
MAFASATTAEAELPRFKLPALPAGQARRLAGRGLTLALLAGGSLAALAVSLTVASVWMRAVSHNAPTTLHMTAPSAPLVSALGEWHRGMIRAAAHSGPASGFGTAPDVEPQDAAPALPAPVVVPKPVVPPAPAPMPTVKPAPAAVPVPLPPKRPHVADVHPEEQPAPVARAAPLPAPEPVSEPKVAAAPAPAPAAPAPAREPKVAALPPPAPEGKASALPIDGRTAVYDIEGHTVYLPNGRRLEAHSGLGGMMDDPRYTRVKMRGPTPPNVYALTMREQLFHGVRAIRLTPVDEGKMHGRDGMLAHTYMLGPNGQSNGCVSFRDYDAFLDAFKDGKINRLAVIAKLD